MWKPALVKHLIKAVIAGLLLYLFFRPVPFTANTEPDDVFVPVNQGFLLLDNPLWDAIKPSIADIKQRLYQVKDRWIGNPKNRVKRLAALESLAELFAEEDCHQLSFDSLGMERTENCFTLKAIEKRLGAGCEKYKRNLLSPTNVSAPVAFVHLVDGKEPTSLAQLELLISTYPPPKHRHCLVIVSIIQSS